MPSIHVYRRKRKRPDGTTYLEKNYVAEIRFGREYGFLRSTGCESCREAEREAKRIAAEIEKTEIPRLRSPSLTLDGLFGRWWQEHAQHKSAAPSIDGYITRIIEHFGPGCPADLITNTKAHDFVQSLRSKSLSASTINHHLKTLRSALNYAEKRWGATVSRLHWGDHLQATPKERLVWLTRDQAADAYRRLPENIALAFGWSIYTGCRLDETETLEWNRIFMVDRVASVMAKGGGERIVYLSSQAIAILRRCGELYGESGRVFDFTGRRTAWEKVRDEIGRPEMRWHDLRHTFATWLRQSGADMKKTSLALGHSRITTTAVYAHVGDGELAAAVERLPDIGVLSNAPYGNASVIN